MSSIPLPIGIFRPSTSGVYVPSYDQVATNDLWDFPVLAFIDNSAKESAHAALVLPDDFPATPSAVSFDVSWTSAVTTGNFQIDIDYRVVGGNDTESLDQATVQEALTVADVAPSVAHRRLLVNLAATASNFNSAASKVLELTLSRDGVDEVTSIAGEVFVVGLLLKFT